MLFYFLFILLFCYSAVVLCALEAESNGTLAMVAVCALAYSLCACVSVCGCVCLCGCVCAFNLSVVVALR